ncbi:MAG: hypothetical protein GY850_17860, partial [bacterium]|nr:hypothetical protein [bacterium]
MPSRSRIENSHDPAAGRDDVLEIEPISFRSDRRLERTKPFIQYRWLISVTAGLIFVLLSVSIWFVFTAKQVAIRIDPEPDRISINGGLMTPRLASYYLLRAGEYHLRAVKSCYQPLEKRFQVVNEKSQEIRFVMEKLPGR